MQPSVPLLSWYGRVPTSRGVPEETAFGGSTDSLAVDGETAGSWQARPFVAAAIRVAVFLVPIAVAVLVQILFGSTQFFGQNVVANITELIGSFGQNGLVGLFAFGVLLYVFNKQAKSIA